MPKSKTKSGAKKRFTITGTGKIKRKKAYMRHILTKKATGRKRALGIDGLVHPSDAKSIRSQLLVP
jgi:large subunit ribosomal protein L35